MMLVRLSPLQPVAWLLALLTAALPAAAETETEKSGIVIFAAYGDMPYMVKLPDGRTDEQVLSQDVAPAIRNSAEIPFVIHLGDVARPQYACTDAWLEKIREFWQKELVKPVFYTPGDNEWTDCDRPKLAEPKSELARLDAIRRLFFSKPVPLGRDWRYEQQASLPENQTWQYKGVRFVTQHMVSTDNGRKEILLDDPERAIRLVDKRDKENLAWLEHAFILAQDAATQAVVVATQVDMFGPPDGSQDALARCLDSPAYGEFCRRLELLASALNKPVLLIHGDTNAYCLDQPFSPDKSPKLWRLNAPGDYKVVDVARVRFDPSSTDRPFSVTGLLSGQPAPRVCDYSR